jgi:riboflavin synthase
MTKRGGGARLEIRAPQIVGELSAGDSVAVNGACVTVIERNRDTFACDLVPETVSRTTLGILQVEEQVNIERPMRMSDRFGGHLVQGHVDAVGVVRSRRRVGAQEVLEITIPFELTRFLAPQGSVALDGVSLTVVAVDKERFRVALIPYTMEMTTLGHKVQGSSVNVEIDVLSKYVERHVLARLTKPTYLAPVKPAPAPLPVSPKPRRPVPARAATAAAKKPKRTTPKARTRKPARATAKRAATARSTAKRSTAQRSTTKRTRTKGAAPKRTVPKRTAAKRTSGAVKKKPPRAHGASRASSRRAKKRR